MKWLRRWFLKGCPIEAGRMERASTEQKKVVSRLATASLDDIEQSNMLIKAFPVREAAASALERLERKG